MYLPASQMNVAKATPTENSESMPRCLALSLPWSTYLSSLESPSAHSVRSAPRTAYSLSGDQFFSCSFWSFIEARRCARRVFHIGQPQVESSQDKAQRRFVTASAQICM